MHNRLDVGGWFELVCRTRTGAMKWRALFTNGVTTQGCNAILETAFRSAIPTTYFVGVIAETGYTGVSATDTHGAHPGWAEWQNYSGNRPGWVPGPATGGIMPTIGSFSWVMSAAGSIRGAFLASITTKGSVSSAATLYCTAVMPSSLAVANADVISGTYILTIRE